MRGKLMLAGALAAAGCLSVPARAGGWGEAPCCGPTVYVHHHVYFPPVFRHVIELHRPDASHVHVIHYADTPYGACCAKGFSYQRSYAGYFAGAIAYRWHGPPQRW